jgi:hypothetical protein
VALGEATSPLLDYWRGQSLCHDGAIYVLTCLAVDHSFATLVL